MDDRIPTDVEMDHLRWLARSLTPLGIALPTSIAGPMMEKGWIEGAMPWYIIKPDSPYLTARITTTGRAVLSVYGGDKNGKEIPYQHGSKWPWTLRKYRSQFKDEIAYTARMNKETR